MREKLIELLWEYDQLRMMRMSIEECVDKLIANGVTIQRWIPVTERLPETGKRIIVCRGDKVEQGVYLGVNGWWKVYGANTKAVTHWMPMPEPPKEATP